MVSFWSLLGPMAYVPDDNERLYFGDKKGFIHATPIPAVESSGGKSLELKPLNEKLFLRGLVD
jgi:hypothetical protein